MKNQTQKFWVVWCRGGSPPTVPHPTVVAAEREAERLARDHRGQTFVVLEALRSVTRTDVTWAEASEDYNLPF